MAQINGYLRVECHLQFHYLESGAYKSHTCNGLSKINWSMNLNIIRMDMCLTIKVEIKKATFQKIFFLLEHT